MLSSFFKDGGGWDVKQEKKSAQINAVGWEKMEWNGDVEKGSISVQNLVSAKSSKYSQTRKNFLHVFDQFWKKFPHKWSITLGLVASAIFFCS